jgi:hemolysin activation/secretion protein
MRVFDLRCFAVLFVLAAFFAGAAGAQTHVPAKSTKTKNSKAKKTKSKTTSNAASVKLTTAPHDAQDKSTAQPQAGRAAYEKLLAEADRLEKSGKPAAAYTLLESWHANDPRFNYLLGIAALDSGKLEKAILAFGRVLAEDPGFTGARLDMARAYYQSGDKTRAKAEFLAVMDQNPPEEAKATIRKYLDMLGAQEAPPVSAPAEPSPAPTETASATQSPDAPSLAGQPPSNQSTDNNGNSALVRIERFQVEGNTLLDGGMIERLLAPYRGDAQSYTDIQLALEALEGAYRSAGYSAVNVVTPEQDITGGTVTFQVIETVVGKVILSGNRHYDKTNIRNALPALAEGYTPSARELSGNIRLANENPTRQIDLVLALGEEPNTVDAQVNVQDSSPHKVFLTLDNAGNQTSGLTRAGVGYQHNNLFNRDHALTFNYITSPGHVKDVTQLSAGYRMPFYAWGDSADLIAAYSNVGGLVGIADSQLSFNGQGRVYGLHYNHYLPRRGDYTAKIVAGLDYRDTISNCVVDAASTDCGSINVHPASLAYSGTLTKPGYIGDYTATLAHNIPGGARGGAEDFSAARSHDPGTAGASPNYSILRLVGSLAGTLPRDWQYRVAGNIQYTNDALVPGEYLSLVGANAVRGFLEREVTNDKGAILNLEIYTPELASQFGMQNGSFRLLGFVDRARGWKVPLAGEQMEHNSVGSVGAGIRFSYGKNLTTRFDYARVTQAGGGSKVGDMRGQINLMAIW